MSKKAIVVLSGGQDSTTCLMMAVMQHGQDKVHAVSFDYGQRHHIELESAANVAKLCGVSHEVIAVRDILGGTSPLTDNKQPLEQYENAEQMEAIIGDRVEKTFVPMRNALFLTIAANRAVVHGATLIYTGVCEADNANYPDCRERFIEHQEGTINEALGLNETPITQRPGYIEIITPLMHMSKAQSIAAMDRLGGLPLLAFTHTAYDGQYPPVGNDHATLLRAQGFEKAGLPDPLVVRAIIEGRMQIPATDNYQKVLGTGRWDGLVAAIKKCYPLLSDNMVEANPHHHSIQEPSATGGVTHHGV
jgi:7-cyano-7-deazaguanine synthase